MKRIFLAIMLITFFLHYTQASQTTVGGIKNGYNSSKFVGQDAADYSMEEIPGFNLGGFLCYQINERFAIQPELLLSTKGSRIHTVGELCLSNILMYFEIPILIKINLKQVSMLKPYILYGSALNIKCFAINDVSIISNIRSRYFSMILGAGLNFWKIYGDIRFDRGLLNFDESAEKLRLKNQTVSFLLGYSF